jgi:hypothetical protein
MIVFVWANILRDWPMIGIGIGPIFALLVDNQNQ